MISYGYEGVNPNSPEYDILTKQIEEAESALTKANVDMLDCLRSN